MEQRHERLQKSRAYPVSRHALWGLLADTERLNRDLNLPPVRASLEPGGVLRGAARFGPLTIRYIEEPYCWVKAERWQVTRLPENGPLSRYSVGLTLETNSTGCVVRAWCEVEPRGALGRLVARRIAQTSVEGLHRACAAYVAHLSGEVPVPHPRRSLARWDGESVAERLGSFLASAPDEDVVLFRPYSLADRFGSPRRDVLCACLSAVRTGSLTLSWRLLCPACRGAGEPGPRLDELTESDAHCPSCDIRFRPAFDRDIEVCFSHAHRKSKVGAATFCRGGPHHAAHVALQWFVPAGESRTVEVHLPGGAYRLRSPHADGTVDVALQRGGDDRVERVGRELRSPGILARSGVWTLVSPEDGPTLFCLDSQAWREDAATAAEVSLLGEFRRHFGSEVLVPGVAVSAGRVCLLFTDLKGSTALYAEQGDAPGYRTVREHFSQMERLIEESGGTIVKTIGDAVMAAFPTPAAALGAALALQAQTPDPQVKCGVHAGPALAIEANGVLDYFGQSVNIAARIQAQSVGGDIVLAEALLTDPEVASLVRKLPQERFSAHLKGVGELALVRLTLSGSRAG